MKTVTCLACGWVLVAYSRAQAQKEVDDFNTYFESLPEQKRIENYRNQRASITRYEQCFSCGGSYKNFRLSQKDDCPVGVTLQSIIQED